MLTMLRSMVGIGALGAQEGAPDQCPLSPDAVIETQLKTAISQAANGQKRPVERA